VLFTSNLVDYQKTTEYDDFQRSMQKWSAPGRGQESGESKVDPCFTTLERRAIKMDDPNALNAIVQPQLGVRKIDHLRKLVYSIKSRFPLCCLPATTGLNSEAIMELLQLLAAPNTAPSAAQIWNALYESLNSRHGTGPELVMVVRILDWIAFTKQEDTLPIHPLEVTSLQEGAVLDLPVPVVERAAMGLQPMDCILPADPVPAVDSVAMEELQSMNGMLSDDPEPAVEPTAMELQPIDYILPNDYYSTGASQQSSTTLNQQDPLESLYQSPRSASTSQPQPRIQTPQQEHEWEQQSPQQV
jgi:hypothetical protein